MTRCRVDVMLIEMITPHVREIDECFGRSFKAEIPAELEQRMGAPEFKIEKAQADMRDTITMRWHIGGAGIVIELLKARSLCSVFCAAPFAYNPVTPRHAPYLQEEPHDQDPR
jgi:hypothetical protein